MWVQHRGRATKLVRACARHWGPGPALRMLPACLKRPPGPATTHCMPQHAFRVAPAYQALTALHVSTAAPTLAAIGRAFHFLAVRAAPPAAALPPAPPPPALLAAPSCLGLFWGMAAASDAVRPST